MALSAVLVAVVSCDKPAQPTGTQQPFSIKVTPAEPAPVLEQGGTIILTLASRSDWEAQEVPSWIAVSPASGAGAYTPQVVTLTVAPNNGEAREAVLKFVDKGSSAEVKVQQNKGGSSVIFYEKFDKSMGDFTVKDVTVPEQIPVIWEFSSKYVCMKATAFANPNNYA